MTKRPVFEMHRYSVLIRLHGSDAQENQILSDITRVSLDWHNVSLLLRRLRFQFYIENRPNFVCPESPAFIFADSTALIRQKINCTLKALPGWRYYSHCFGIGAATTASEAGLLPVETFRLGRWKSDAYKLYIHSTTQSAWGARMAQQL